MRKFFGKIISYIPLLLILFLGLKSCIKTSYTQEELEVYRNVMSTGEINTIFFTPSNHIVLQKGYDDLYDYAVFRARGENATHYFGSLDNLGDGLFSLRRYPEAEKVWNIELELIDKGGNLPESTFSEIGSRYRNSLIFQDESVILGSDYYEEIQVTEHEEMFIDLVVEK